MDITYQIVYGVSKLLISMSQDSPLKSIANQELEMAKYILSSASSEANCRECLNRALTHLESSYVNFLPTITTWDVLSRDRVLWSKRTFANSICLHIAIIHYILGNISISKKWLLDNLNEKGGIYFPKAILDSLSVSSEDSFYHLVCQSDYHKLETILRNSNRNYYTIFDIPSDLDLKLDLDLDSDPGPALRSF